VISFFPLGYRLFIRVHTCLSSVTITYPSVFVLILNPDRTLRLQLPQKVFHFGAPRLSCRVSLTPAAWDKGTPNTPTTTLFKILRLLSPCVRYTNYKSKSTKHPADTTYWPGWLWSEKPGHTVLASLLFEARSKLREAVPGNKAMLQHGAQVPGDQGSICNRNAYLLFLCDISTALAKFR